LLEIYKAVLSTTIKYPSDINISPDMESLIKGCLQINEEDRFDWFQLYNHPIFRGAFSQNFSNMKKGE
jgi:serine/threonine protein kinase